MFITKKHISRRTILKGAGVNVALPFLSAMVPAATALAQTAAAPKIRTGFFYIPHGAIMYLASAELRRSGEHEKHRAVHPILARELATLPRGVLRRSLFA